MGVKVLLNKKDALRCQLDGNGNPKKRSTDEKEAGEATLLPVAVRALPCWQALHSPCAARKGKLRGGAQGTAASTPQLPACPNPEHVTAPCLGVTPRLPPSLSSLAACLQGTMRLRPSPRPSTA